MGTGKQFSLHEIDETRAAGRDEAFEQIIERIKASGAEITKDDTTPLYTEVGRQELEVGTQRVVEFSKKEDKTDFQITRKVETHTLQGGGHQKHVEPLDSPRSQITLKTKVGFNTDWQVVDLEDMF